MNTADFNGATVLVTGASGFIGSHLCRRLSEAGAHVHALARTRPSIGGHPRIRGWRGDLADPATAREIVDEIRPDTIFHLAAHVAGSRDAGLIMPTFRSNLAATVNLLAAASEIGCRRIVLSGSLEEPEPVRGPGPEHPHPVPSSPYAASKWAGNAYARMCHALYGLPVVILRLFMVYGPAQRDLNKLIPYVILSLYRGRAPRLTAGERPVDWIYVEDGVDAFLAAAGAERVEGGTLDVGSGNLVPVKTVARLLVDRIDPTLEPVFGALPERPLEQVRAADTARTEAALGWRPRVGLEDGLDRTVRWYERRLVEGLAA